MPEITMRGNSRARVEASPGPFAVRPPLTVAAVISGFLPFLDDQVGDRVDQAFDVLGLLQRAVHRDVDVEFFLERREDHDDVDRLEVQALDRRFRRDLGAIDHPFGGDDIYDFVDEFFSILRIIRQVSLRFDNPDSDPKGPATGLDCCFDAFFAPNRSPLRRKTLEARDARAGLFAAASRSRFSKAESLVKRFGGENKARSPVAKFQRPLPEEPANWASRRTGKREIPQDLGLSYIETRPAGVPQDKGARRPRESGQSLFALPQILFGLADIVARERQRVDFL